MRDHSTKRASTRPSKTLYELMNELRGQIGVDPVKVVLAARERGIPVTSEDIRSLTHNMERFGEGPTPAKFVIDFMIRYLHGRSLGHVLDPWAGNGVLLTEIAAAIRPLKATGISPNADARLIAETISDQLPIQWLSESPRTSTDHEFDLIVSAPPMGISRRTTIQPSGMPTTVTVDHYQEIAKLQDLSSLSSGGEVVLVLSDAFFSRRRGGANVTEALAGLNLYPSAVIALAGSPMGRATSIPMNIVILTRTAHDQLFVAQLSDGGADSIIANLMRRRKGSLREQGMLVLPGGFKSWRTTKLDDDIRLMGAKVGLRPIPMGDVADAILRPSAEFEDGFEHRPNSVYLPTSTTMPVVSSVDELSSSPRSYVQLVIRPEIAFAEYVAQFLNTDLGRAVRALHASGTITPRLDVSRVAQMSVFIPSITVQQEALAVDRAIRELRLQLHGLDARLWERPGSAADVRRDLSRLNDSDPFGTWVDSLPFPMASVLDRYRATSGDRDKVDHLQHFFEATAQLFVNIMLSAFRSDQSYYESNRITLLPTVGTSRIDWTRSSFGNWIVLGSQLAKTTRRLLSSGDRNICIDLYKSGDAHFPEAISNPVIYTLLKEANDVRIMKSHGGAEGERTWNMRLSRLMSILTRFQEALTHAFNDVMLCQPIPNTGNMSESGLHQVVRQFVGGKTTFTEKRIAVPYLLVSEQLYLINSKTGIPLRLLPLMRFMASPDDQHNACYFFDRVEGSEVAWISYHFETPQRPRTTDNDVTDVLAELAG